MDRPCNCLASGETGMVSATCIFHTFAIAVTKAEITPTSRHQQTRQIDTCTYLIKKKTPPYINLNICLFFCSNVSRTQMYCFQNILASL